MTDNEAELVGLLQMATDWGSRKKTARSVSHSEVARQLIGLKMESLNEKMTNSQAFKRVANEPIDFGTVVTLQHVASQAAHLPYSHSADRIAMQRFLCLRPGSRSEHDCTALQLRLEDSATEDCSFVIMPAFKVCST